MNVQLVLILLILLQTISPINPIFNNGLKKLKEKSKAAFKKKFGKDKSWHFLGFDLTEFPGTNDKYRQINTEKWDNYYACSEAQNTGLGRDFSVTPEAVQAVESSSISPQEAHKIESVEWYWAGEQDMKLQLVDYTENVLVAASDRALQIYNLQKQQSGQYICAIGKTQGSPYFLTVVASNDEDINSVHSLESPSGPYPQKPKTINNYNLTIDTEWLPWTSCNKCGQIGRRYRLGYCIVRYDDNLNGYTETSNETDLETTTVSKDHYELLRIFKFGLPCSSHILPKSMKKLHYLSQRKNEIMSGFCKMDCPENKVFEVRDKNGKVIESANNSAGIYSALQGIPSMQPSVERLLQYGNKGKEVTISCPGNLNMDVPVEWQISSKKLVPELLVTESKGRIFISITDKIHIKDAKISDTNIYSCWQHEDLAGTVRLIVEKRLSLDFNHHLMLFGATSIFSVMLYVFLKVFLRRKTIRNMA